MTSPLYLSNGYGVINTNSIQTLPENTKRKTQKTQHFILIYKANKQ